MSETKSEGFAIGIAPTEEQMRDALDGMRTIERTAELRFAVSDRAPTQPPRLQQKVIWHSRTAGGYEWEDVPTVVVSEPSP